jgi:hypothetical protein
LQFEDLQILHFFAYNIIDIVVASEVIVVQRLSNARVMIITTSIDFISSFYERDMNGFARLLRRTKATPT